MRNLLRRFISDTRGNFAIMGAGCMVLVLGCTALGVDVGSIYADRRKARSAADLAAIVAAGNLGKATSAAATTVMANGYPASALLSVELGTFTANATLAPQARFVTPATGAPNAARVTLRTETPLYFARMFAAAATTSTSPPGQRPRAPHLPRSRSVRDCSRLTVVYSTRFLAGCWERRCRFR